MMENQMLFGSATTTELDTDKAIDKLVTQVDGQMNGRAIDVALVFLSPHFRLGVADFSGKLEKSLNARVLIGCTGEGVIGREQEIEHGPAVTLAVAHLPNVELKPFTLQSMDWDKTLKQAEVFRQTVAAPSDTKLFVMLADPFTTPMDAVLEAFNSYYAGLPVTGGMASGSHRAGGNALILNGRVLNNGAVGVAFAGAFEVDVIVSQGCRPIGQSFTVTEAEANVVLSLDGISPLGRLRDLISQLSEEDQALLQNGLFLGRAISPSQEALGRGDFLIRSVMGLDQQSGAMVVGDYIQPGETIQFHLRDATTAAEDLEMMLTPQMFLDPPSGAFLFSCNGRGTRLYDYPNGDISTIQKAVGQVDLAGFFCAGEIGPIGGKNFLHGHTASLALFRPQVGKN